MHVASAVTRRFTPGHSGRRYGRPNVPLERGYAVIHKGDDTDGMPTRIPTGPGR